MTYGITAVFYSYLFMIYILGGILSRGITEISGESASGKTQFALQLSLTAQLPETSGGLDGGKVL